MSDLNTFICLSPAAPLPARSRAWSATASALACACTLLGALPGGMPMAHAADTGVLSNGSFEAGLSGWTASGSVTLSSDAADGSLSASLADENASLSLTLSEALPTDAITDFSLWAANSSGVFNLVVLHYADGSSSGLDALLWGDSLGSWEAFSLTDALAAGQLLSGFTLYGNSAAATLIDGVTLQVSAVPEPAAATLLLGGLLAVAGLGRTRRR